MEGETQERGRKSLRLNRFQTDWPRLSALGLFLRRPFVFIFWFAFEKGGECHSTGVALYHRRRRGGSIIDNCQPESGALSP